MQYQPTHTIYVLRMTYIYFKGSLNKLYLRKIYANKNRLISYLWSTI